jgi:DNA-directed RNA polymerase subunit omega
MEKEKLDQLMEKVGGREKLTLILQRRLKELSKGDAPLVENPPKDLVEIALLEIFEGKVDTSVQLPPATFVETYEGTGRPSPMMRAPRPGPRPIRRGGNYASPGPGPRQGGGMRRSGPPRRFGGPGGNRGGGGGRWQQGPR